MAPVIPLIIIRALATRKGKNIIKDTIKKHGQTEYNVTRDLYIKQNKKIPMSDNQIISKAREMYAKYTGKNVVGIKTGKSINKAYGGKVDTYRSPRRTTYKD